MFKECLKNNIPPFVIEDSAKEYYRRGLNEYASEKDILLRPADYHRIITKNVRIF